jgi:recombination protein RecA
MAERLDPSRLDSLARWGIRRGGGPALRGRRRVDVPTWTLDDLAGRVVELSGAGAAAWLTLTFPLVVEAQTRGEPVAWVTTRQSTFFPPDAAENGVDLAALPVVFVPDAPAAARAAERLVRSGAFALVVLDLVEGRAELPPALQSRLAGLAQRHEAAVLCLTEKTGRQPSLGPLVSLRCTARREEPRDERFVCRVEVLKDKSSRGGWADLEVCRGPAGLR